MVQLLARWLTVGLLLCSLPAVAPAASRKDQARHHFKLGKAAFEQRRYREALSHYQRAYRAFALPGFLFNIGQCHRNLGQPRPALAAFRRYLARAPRAGNRQAVESLIADLEREIAAEAAPDSGPSIDEPDASVGAAEDASTTAPGFATPIDSGPVKRDGPGHRPFYKTWWFWTAVVAVVGGGTAGIYLGARSSGPSFPDTPFDVVDLSR